MSIEVKTVKNFFSKSGVQFDVILRREPGEVFKFHVKGNAGFSESFDYIETIFPKNEEGIIRIVKRICDDDVFHQSDLVEVGDIGTCFISEFCEDLIHCFIVDLDNIKHKVQVDCLITVILSEQIEN